MFIKWNERFSFLSLGRIFKRGKVFIILFRIFFIFLFKNRLYDDISLVEKGFEKVEVDFRG